MLSRRVELRRGSVESLPYDRNTFDAALAINSFQVWQNAVAGLREIHRVMKPGGRVALDCLHLKISTKRVKFCLKVDFGPNIASSNTTLSWRQ